jgi:ferredoxin
MSKIKVSVNHNKCVGSQLCIMFSPDVFELNANGQSKVTSIEGHDLKELIATAEQCPQCAIKVLNVDTGVVLFPPEGLSF